MAKANSIDENGSYRVDGEVSDAQEFKRSDRSSRLPRYLVTLRTPGRIQGWKPMTPPMILISKQKLTPALVSPALVLERAG